MKKIEASGRTIQEAVEMAAQELGVSVEAVEYETVEEGTRGFLGLGQTPYRVRAWIAKDYEARARRIPPVEKPVREELPEEEEEEPAIELPESEVEEEIEEEELMEEETALTQPETDEAKAFDDVVMKTLGDILAAFDIDAKPVLKSADGEEVTVDIIGRDVAILIGKRGQTLDALQYIIGIIASKRAHMQRRVILDAEGYRRRHAELLERKAHEYAQAVKQEGKEAVLEPQPARDRRIIHLALADDPDIYTYSEGEGEDRHVVISPKK